MEQDNSGAKFIYFLAGLSIGALVGILFAPQSGKETREFIAGRAEDGREYLSRKGRQYREQAAEYVERGKEVISQQKEHLAAAIEAGKQAYRAESQSKAAKE
ncbi:MAG: YtxH domain-containing protein [Acidobacteria bacterium]|nr:YtxH domain-containing protein [Acidobacteriota bacterium]